ncbi:hypothetical protein AMK59_3278 [Oryctes borbonicus]|uniref:Replication protein A C-terminal domain-containing protein n=1 Tax=Oryctes borbonicus TaxID=1629725 RepID=A0A0T6B760_9SCAR|nr:hypothetical protein AMK59_3278 [Oryctes borbonicus]
MWNAMDTTGGGFMSDTNQFDSPSGKKEQVQRLQSVVPVAIRQIRDCPEEEFKLFGMQTQILCIVGILRDYNVQSTKATYQVEDHTGSMPCIWWLDAETGTTPNLPAVKEGCYLRLYGSLRTHDGVRSIMVMRMFPIDNINEVTTHLLEVIHARLEAENMSKDVSTKVKHGNPGSELANTMAFMGNDDKNFDSGFTPIQQKVYNILKPVVTDRGLNINTILSQFAQGQHKDVRAALEFLMNEGHAYSTIDNDHFKVTECM